MSITYVDTSTLVAIAFEKPGGSQAGERLEGFSRLLSSNLLEAELRAVFARERQEFDSEVLSRIEWILPDRPLAIELERALEAGYLRVRICGTSPRRSTSRQGQRKLDSRRSATGSGISPRVSGRNRLVDCGFRLGRRARATG